MSETDDTDELLIIPPDFFLTNTTFEPESSTPYYSIVDGLITQVGELEDRINRLQNSSELNLSILSTTTSSDMMMTSPSRIRKFKSNEDLQQKTYPSSTQSTPQKPRTKFTMNSLPNSPDVDRFRKSPRRGQSPQKPSVNPMIGEIDNFISNVKLIKRMNAVRNLESDFSSNDAMSSHSKSLDMDEVDAMLNEMEAKQKQREEKIRQKEDEIIFKQTIEKPFTKESNKWSQGDNVNTVPDYGLGMRKTMYSDNVSIAETYTKTTAMPLAQQGKVSSANADSDSSSDTTTQATTYEKPNYNAKSFDISKKIQSIGKHYNLGMVSLANLWNSNDLNEMPAKFQQRLHEERLRRQHCEQAISELQNRILELQERVAVAIQVDEAKDKAILRFHRLWEQSNMKLEQFEQENGKLKQDMDKVQQDMKQKIIRYENENSKALTLAHASQDKLARLEKRFAEIEHELRIATLNSEEFQKKYMSELDKNKQYPEIIAQKELELNENKNVLADAKAEIYQSRKAVETCQNEFIAMKAENEALGASLQRERDNVKKLSEQKVKIEEEINLHKNITKGLQEELQKARDQLENNKVELKNYYQGQVELVVQNKLKEFQSQLDEAEKKLKEEFTKKEMSIAKTAASHIQQISEKHSLEIKLLEEKHQEECRLYRIQMSQMQREADETNQKLKRQHDKQTVIERQLCKFMETLKQDASAEEIHSFRTKSFSNLEEILSLNAAAGDADKNAKKSADDPEAASTYRIGETPISSRPERGGRRKDSARENNLQETIQMLLDKKGGHGDVKSGDDLSHQASLYQKLAKEKGKPSWK